MNYARSRQATILLSVFFVVLYVTSVLFVFRNHDQEYADYVFYRDAQFTSTYENTINGYENFSNYIFYTEVNREHILRWIAQANDADESVQAEIREKLYEELEDDYSLIQNYDFQHFHFHLANGDSFLRFHNPESFGDNLLSVRESIRIANVEKVYVSGFEEGRIINGYRFVYPLIFKGEHVGSVEVSVSMMSIFDYLNQGDIRRDMGFLLYRDSMMETVLIEDQGRYEVTPLSDLFVTDIEIDRLMEQTPDAINLMQNEYTVEKIRTALRDEINNMQSFSESIYVDNTAYLAQFLAVEDVSGHPVAYLYSISESRVIYDMYIQKIILIVISSVSLIIIFSLLFFITRTQKKLRYLAMYDPLTKIYNRTVFFNFASKLLAQQHRDHSSFCVAMLDIDHFKRINDTFGHHTGDVTLVELTRIVSEAIRPADLFARFGGEEFVLLLPQTTIDEAQDVLERIRKAVERHDFSKIGRITLSAGIAKIEETDILHEAISRSDQALYTAKSSGRNKVIVYSEDKVLE